MSLDQPQAETVSPCDPVLATANFGTALRVIGQDLAGLFPRILEIETDGVNFQARGECHPNPFEAVKESFIKSAWQKLFGGTTAAVSRAPRSPACFERSYDRAEIDRLEQLNRAHRGEALRRADAYSLSERLRTLGAIVDSKKGRLKRLHKEADRLFVEYWDQQGQLQSAKLTTVIMYRSQHRHDSQPRNAPSELWEGYDF